jgi:hypothetical protein
MIFQSCENGSTMSSPRKRSPNWPPVPRKTSRTSAISRPTIEIAAQRAFDLRVKNGASRTAMIVRMRTISALNGRSLEGAGDEGFVDHVYIAPGMPRG